MWCFLVASPPPLILGHPNELVALIDEIQPLLSWSLRAGIRRREIILVGEQGSPDGNRLSISNISRSQLSVGVRFDLLFEYLAYVATGIFKQIESFIDLLAIPCVEPKDREPHPQVSSVQTHGWFDYRGLYFSIYLKCSICLNIPVATSSKSSNSKSNRTPTDS